MSEHKRSGPPPEQLVVMFTFLGILGLMAGVAFFNNGDPADKPAAVPTCVQTTFAPPVAAPVKTGNGAGTVKQGKPRTVRIVQSNMWFKISGSQLLSDLGRVVADRPDFVTLNEVYKRTASEITPSGYSSWRAEAPFDARETPVLWRTDLWKKAEAGTYLMHGASGKWGIRYTNWVVLEARKGGQTVSIISVHASPGDAGRRLFGDYMAALGRLIAPLRTRGPVFISGDFNINYLAPGPGGALVQAMKGFGAISTYEALGQPPGGWRTDHGGGTIDYVFVSGAKTVGHSVQGLQYTNHKMVTAAIRLPSVPRLVLNAPAQVTPVPVVRPVVTCAP